MTEQEAAKMWLERAEQTMKRLNYPATNEGQQKLVMVQLLAAQVYYLADIAESLHVRRNLVTFADLEELGRAIGEAAK